MTSENHALTVNQAFWQDAYLETFKQLCYRASRRLTRGDSAAAEDIVSQTFVKLMDSGLRIEEIQHPFRYFWVAIRNAWISQQNKREVTNTVRLEDLDTKTLEEPAFRLQPKVQEMLERQDSLEKLIVKLGPLTLEEKEMIELIVEGCSWPEVAKEMGEDVATTYLRWRRLIFRQRYRFSKMKN